MSRFWLAPVLLSAVLTGSFSARADDEAKKQDFAKRLFAGKLGQNDKTYACFKRVYSAEHLARHPKQKVNRMMLLVTAEKAPSEGASGYSFRLGLAYRNRKGTFDSSGECRNAIFDEKPGEISARFGCSVDCDGGGIGIDLTKDNHAAILRVERVRIWRNNKPDEEASYSLEAGQDDHIFRLERVDDKQCYSLVTDREELAAMRKK
jgi:hypothetical protein